MASLRLAAGAALLSAAVAFLAPTATAHQQFDAGHYHIEVGWQHEPPLVDAPNAIEVVVTDSRIPDEADRLVNGAVLNPTLMLGGDSKSLAVASDPEESPGVYEAAVLPTEAGMYQVHVTGTVNGTRIDVTTTQLEEVVAPSDLAFPQTHGSYLDLQGQQTTLWIVSAAAGVLGLLGVALALVALRRRPASPAAQRTVAAGAGPPPAPRPPTQRPPPPRQG